MTIKKGLEKFVRRIVKVERDRKSHDQFETSLDIFAIRSLKTTVTGGM